MGDFIFWVQRRVKGIAAVGRALIDCHPPALATHIQLLLAFVGGLWIFHCTPLARWVFVATPQPRLTATLVLLCLSQLG